MSTVCATRPPTLSHRAIIELRCRLALQPFVHKAPWSFTAHKQSIPLSPDLLLWPIPWVCRFNPFARVRAYEYSQLSGNRDRRSYSVGQGDRCSFGGRKAWLPLSG